MLIASFVKIDQLFQKLQVLRTETHSIVSQKPKFFRHERKVSRRYQEEDITVS